MYILDVYEQPYYMYIERLLLNGLHIMVTLCIYFEYIQVLCKILTKYIVAILKVYLKILLYFLKLLQMKLLLLNVDIYSFTRAIIFYIIILIF